MRVIKANANQKRTKPDKSRAIHTENADVLISWCRIINSATEYLMHQ